MLQHFSYICEIGTYNTYTLYTSFYLTKLLKLYHHTRTISDKQKTSITIQKEHDNCTRKSIEKMSIHSTSNDKMRRVQ